MHRALFPQDTAPFPKGDYLIEDLHASWFLGDGLCTLQAPGFDLKPLDLGVDWNGKRILIGRAGSIGDLIFITPIFREIKRRWPTVQLHAFCWPQYAGTLQGNPHLDAIIPYPVPVDVYASYDARIWLENVVERHPKANEAHVIDLFAEHAGVPLEDKTGVYRPAKEELRTVGQLYPKAPGRPRLGIQVVSSTPVRTYPVSMTLDLVVQMLRKGWEVFLFGQPGQVPGNAATGRNFVNLTLRNPPPTLRESAAIMASCDVFLGPDSGLVHMAGAMKIPTVALYASFPWQIRTAYAPSIVPLTGVLLCAPCFHHSHRAIFPPGGPCNKSQQCDALAAIPIARVIETIESLAPKVPPAAA